MFRCFVDDILGVGVLSPVFILSFRLGLLVKVVIEDDRQAYDGEREVVAGVEGSGKRTHE